MLLASHPAPHLARRTCEPPRTTLITSIWRIEYLHHGTTETIGEETTLAAVGHLQAAEEIMMTVDREAAVAEETMTIEDQQETLLVLLEVPSEHTTEIVDVVAGVKVRTDETTETVRTTGLRRASEQGRWVTEIAMAEVSHKYTIFSKSLKAESQQLLCPDRRANGDNRDRRDDRARDDRRDDRNGRSAHDGRRDERSPRGGASSRRDEGSSRAVKDSKSNENHQKSKAEPEHGDEGEYQEEDVDEDAMAAMMGFGGFGTTKVSCLSGQDLSVTYT